MQMLIGKLKLLDLLLTVSWIWLLSCWLICLVVILLKKTCCSFTSRSARMYVYEMLGYYLKMQCCDLFREMEMLVTVVCNAFCRSVYGEKLLKGDAWWIALMLIILNQLCLVWLLHWIDGLKCSKSAPEPYCDGSPLWFMNIVIQWNI